MALSAFPKTSCLMCGRYARCDLHGAYCRDVLFAWANDREIPACGEFVTSVRAEIGYVPPPPSMSAGKSRMIRRFA